MKNPFLTFLESPANWFAMACAGLASLLVVSGFVDPGPLLAAGLIALAYAGGFGLGCRVFGFDSGAADRVGALPGAIGDGRHRMTAALAGVRALVRDNPGKRLKRPLREQIEALCNDVDGLLRLIDEHRDGLSAEQAFRAEQIATRYLPDALRAYLAIPKTFAATERLDNGLTAQETLMTALADIGAQAQRLTTELVQRGARDLVNQAAFLDHKSRHAGGRDD